jgi:serine O-acetyltransferase
MRHSLPIADLETYVSRLLANHLPDGYVSKHTFGVLFGRALERVEYCFSRINRKYYRDKDEVVFDHMNTDHMAVLLYFYANTVWRESGDVALPTRLFYLNKIMHGLDLFYSVVMPDIFFPVHPVGTIIGNARFSDYFVFYEQCVVGAIENVYPRFGTGIVMYARTSVIGNCQIGNDVVLAANSFIVNVDVPSDTVVVGQYPGQRLLPNNRSTLQRCFGA